MHKLEQIIIFLCLLTASCGGKQISRDSSTKARLLIYQPNTSTLLILSEDLSGVDYKLRISLPLDCTLMGLYPSPNRDHLLAELICVHGPVTVKIDMGSGNVQPLISTSHMDSHFLGWSGDGNWIYVRINSMSDPRIVRVEVESLRVSEVELNPYTYDLAPSLVEDRIIYSFTQGMGFGSQVWSARADGSFRRHILSDPDNIIAFVRPSPEGEQFAFIRIPDTQVAFSIGTLCVVDNAGRNERKLADADAGHGYMPAWSPDGRQIAFVTRSNPEDLRANQSIDDLSSNMSVVEMSTRIVTQVTHYTHGRISSPAWSPDGNTLAFVYVLNGRMNVQIADPSGAIAPSVIMESACCPVWMRK